MLTLKVKNFDFSHLDKMEVFDATEAQAQAEVLSAPYSEKITLFKNGRPCLVVCSVEYYRRCYSCFFIPGKGFDLNCARFLKKHLWSMIEEKGAIRVESCSPADGIVSRFNRFLGMEMEGVRRKFDGKRDYIIWSIVREC